MNESNGFNHDDLLERATRALSDTPVPDGPPESLVETLLAAVQAEADDLKPSTPSRRIFTMKSITSMAVAATVLLALGLGLFWVLSQGDSNVALADAVDVLLEARTVTCRVTGHGKMKMTMPMEFPGLPASVRAKVPEKYRSQLPKGNRKVTITTTVTTTSSGRLLFLAPSRQRIELETVSRSTTEMTPDDIDPTSEVDKIYLKLLKERKEADQERKMPYIQVFDAATGKSLTLDPDAKKATIVEYKHASEQSKEPGDLFFNVREVIKAVKSGRKGVVVEPLGERTIDGQTVMGYLLHQESLGVKWEFWYNPKTAMAVRIELTMGAGSKGKFENTMVMDQFRTNIDLDESLFSLDVPEGYTSETMKVDFSEPTINDLAKTLRTLADKNQGVFPDKLPDPKNLMASIMKDSAKVSAELAAQAAVNRAEKKQAGNKQQAKDTKPADLTPAQKQAMLDRMQVMSRGVTFLGIIQTPQSDWHYAGRGVKLDTPGVPIFWYKPADSDKYQVLYADLTVKASATAPNPSADPRP